MPDKVFKERMQGVSRGIALFFLLSVVMVCGVKSAHAESLQDAVLSAMNTHPGVEAALAAKSVAGQSRREARSGYFPTVSLGASAGRIYGDNATSRGLSVTRGAGYSNMGEGTIMARQMIFDGFNTRAQVESAEARQKAAEMNVLDARENLAFQAVQAYLNILRTQKVLEILSEHARKVEDYLSRIEAAVEEGVSDNTELQQARDVQAMFEGFVADYAGQAAMADSDYRAIIGHAPDHVMDLPVFTANAVPVEMAAAIHQAWETHPALVSAEMTAQSVEHDIQSEKSALMPTVNGEMSYLRNDKRDIIGGEATDARAVLRMNWDIETGGGQFARVDKKGFEYRESLARMHETRRGVERNIRQAYAELETAQAKLTTQNQRLDLNEKLFETYTVQFEGARINLLQLMQSESQLMNTQIDSLNSAFRVMGAEYGVLASMGALQRMFFGQENPDGGDAKTKENDGRDDLSVALRQEL